MTSNKLTDGVGKKIVEALKQQSDVEIQQVVETPVEKPFFAQEEHQDFNGGFEYIEQPEPEVYSHTEEPVYFQEPQPQPVLSSVNFEQPVPPPFSSNMNIGAQFNKPAIDDGLLNELDGFDIPSNIAVLKQLITKLPAGVSKQTGAQIIKQTMEALGISMKSVLQEAQQVQETLTSSSHNCQNTISEYKRQISVLESQTQKFQKQHAALNDIISLFVQTN